MALKDCLSKFPRNDKAAHPIAPPDREALLQAADTYRERGMDSQEAEVKAVQDMLDMLNADMEDVLDQVSSAFSKLAPNRTKPAAPVKIKPAATPLNIAAKASETPKANLAKITEKKEAAPLRNSPREDWANVMGDLLGASEYSSLPDYARKLWADLTPEQRTRAEAVKIAQLPPEEGVKRSQTQSESENEPTGPTSRVEAVRAELKEFVGTLNPSKIQVVQQSDEIPADVRKAVEKSGPITKRTQGFVHNGKAWLIAANIPEGQARAVFMHEVGSHLGLEGALADKEFDLLVDKINEWAGRGDNSIENKLAVAALKRVWSADVNNSFANTELIAYFVEEAITSGISPIAPSPRTELGRFISRVWLVFKRALDRLGFDVKFAAQDVVDMAYAAARMEMVSKDHGALGTQRSESGEVAELQATIRKLQSEATLAGLKYPNVLLDRMRKLDKAKARLAELNGVQRSERINAAIDALPEPARPMLKSITTNFVDLAKKGVFMGAITDDLADMARPLIPSVDKYMDAQYGRQATQLEHEQVIDKVLAAYEHLPRNERGTGAGSVNEFIHDSTMQNKWGYKLDERSEFLPDSEFGRRFKALSPAGQALVKDVFKYGHDTLRQKQQVVRDAINADYADRIAHEDNTSKKAELETQRQGQQSRYDKLLALQSKGPYAPLKRHGEYVTIGHSKAYIDAKENNDKKLIEKLETDPAHNYVAFGETLAEAEAIRDQIKSRFEEAGGFAVASQKETAAQYMGRNSDMFLAFERMRRQLGQSDDKLSKHLDVMLRDMYLRTLAESSARKAEMHRRGIHGADKDMMRALATQGRADAHFLATTKHNEAVSDAIDAMRKDAKADPAKKADAVRYLNEFLNRHAQSFEANPHRIENAIKRATSTWMLTTSPAFYAQQASQTYVITLPVLAGRHGYFKSAKHINKAYTDVFPIVKNASPTGGVDFNHAPADVREMLKTLAGRGKIDIGIDVETGTWAARGSQGTAAWNRVDRKLRGAIVTLESINRATAAIAAYRMEKSKLMTDGAAPETAHAAAIKYAEKIVQQTHGSYDGFNTPRLLSTAFPGARVITQFRRFQIIQLSLIARLMQNSLKGATPEERAIARKALTFTIGHGLLFTGVLGAPVVSTLAAIASKLFGDPDEPDDTESYLRKAIGDEDIANLVLLGAPAAFGLNLSQKLGWGNMLSLMPFVKSDPFTRKGFDENIVGLLGPAFSLAKKEMDAIGLVRSGEYYKGLEQLLPNGFGNAMKGYRFGDEGVTMRNGDVVMPPEEVTFLDATMQGLGLPTTTITQRNFQQGQKVAYEQFYQGKSQEIMSAYSRAYKTNDSDAIQEARDDWAKLQESRDRNGFKRQPISDLLRAPHEQAKRERQVIEGVEFGKTNKRFVQDVTNR